MKTLTEVLANAKSELISENKRLIEKRNLFEHRLVEWFDGIPYDKLEDERTSKFTANWGWTPHLYFYVNVDGYYFNGHQYEEINQLSGAVCEYVKTLLKSNTLLPDF